MARFGTTVFPRIRIGIGAGRYIYLPVLTTTQRDALSASAGYLIYNSTTTQLENYNGSAWVAVGKVYGDVTFLPLAGGTMSGNIAFSGAQTVDGVDVSDHAADLDAHTYNRFRKLPTGVYLSTTGPSAFSTKELTADLLFAFPFIVPRALTVDRIAIEVTTGAAAGKLARLGIYNDGTNLVPGTLLLDASTVLVDAVALVAVTISQALTKGLYWLVCVSNSTATLRSASFQYSGVGLLGLDSAGRYYDGYEVAQAYGALPSTFPASPTLSQAVPQIRVRLSSLD